MIVHALPAHTNGTQPSRKMTVSSGVIPRGSNAAGAALATSAAFATNAGCAACRAAAAAVAARKLGTVTRMKQPPISATCRETSSSAGGHAYEKKSCPWPGQLSCTRRRASTRRTLSPSCRVGVCAAGRCVLATSFLPRPKTFETSLISHVISVTSYTLQWRNPCYL